MAQNISAPDGMAPPPPSGTRPHLASTIVTMQLGLALAVLLGLMFLSGGLFYLYVRPETAP
ncbi:MAG TPA: hypothetical protein VLA19_10535 [Herpetosiphonaceae bacterium]|nr:hypothetical protein [Herpetosiphonaceae bacterium]